MDNLVPICREKDEKENVLKGGSLEVSLLHMLVLKYVALIHMQNIIPG